MHKPRAAKTNREPFLHITTSLLEIEETPGWPQLRDNLEPEFISFLLAMMYKKVPNLHTPSYIVCLCVCVLCVSEQTGAVLRLDARE